jgi:hypothetical protein
MKTGNVEVQIVDSNTGRAVEGVTLIVDPEGAGSKVVTDYKGRVVITNAPVGDIVQLAMVKPGYKNQRAKAYAYSGMMSYYAFSMEEGGPNHVGVSSAAPNMIEATQSTD